MRPGLLARLLGWVAYYWVSVVIAVIGFALVVVLLFAAVPEVSDAWHRHLNRHVTQM